MQAPNRRELEPGQSGASDATTQIAIKLGMGFIFMMVGIGLGCLMYLHPEGLQPGWNLWVAELVPLIFTLAGAFLTASTLGLTRFAARLIQIVLVLFLVIMNWTAFFVKEGECSSSLSFLGVGLHNGQGSSASCRFSFIVVVLLLDAIVIAAIVMKIRLRKRDAGDGPDAKLPQ